MDQWNTMEKKWNFQMALKWSKHLKIKDMPDPWKNNGWGEGTTRPDQKAKAKSKTQKKEK